MSTKCCFVVEGKPKKVNSISGPFDRARTRPCGKNINIVLRVEYSVLSGYHIRENLFHDFLGFCKEHGEFILSDDSAEVLKRNQGHRLRGVIMSVTEVNHSDIPDIKYFAEGATKARWMAGVKADIKRIMSQRNTRHMSMDDWRTIFTQAVDEITVEQVMES